MRRDHISFSQSYAISQPLPEWRSRVVVAFISLAFFALVARGFWVQVWNSRFYIQRGEARYGRLLSARAPRAQIVDRNGNVLAIGEPADDLWVDPRFFVNANEGQVHVIASVLSLSYEEVEAYRRSNRRFVYLKRLVAHSTAAPLLAQDIPGLYGVRGERRFFPEGELAAQVVGLAGRGGDGVEGVELAANSQLKGRGETREVVVDRLGRVIEDPEYKGVLLPAERLELSIDRNIQRMAFDALKRGVARSEAQAGCAIVLDTATGEILALVNVPTFDPNVPSSGGVLPIRNRALTDAFEPGSTIKPLVVAMAMERGVIRPQTMFDTSPGVLHFHGAEIHDTSNHGTISTVDVIAKSSNIGMVKISEMLASRDMWGGFRQFGVGAMPLTGFPGVTSGMLHAPSHWRPLEQATMAYGYGLSVSLAQLAGAYQALANDGVKVPLTLYRRQKPAVDTVRVVSRRVATQVRDMLEAAVASGGTATMGALPNYRAGAKTGTARKSDGGGYAARKYIGVFAGIAPMSLPRIVVAVMIDTPTKGSFYGGPVAGPVFAEIAQNSLSYLGVRPDRVRSAAKN